MIVAFIALFVALSGVGYAAKRIGSGQIKKNAITASKIKKNAVTTTKIKKDNVTGDRILESSLAKVPDADKLDGSDSAAFEKSSKFTRIASFSLGNNESKEIYKQGPLTLTARCKINDTAIDLADVLISTSQNNAAFDAKVETPDLDIGSLEADRLFLRMDGSSGAPHIQASSKGFAVAADGNQFATELWAGANLFGQAGRCQFGGLIEQVS